MMVLTRWKFLGNNGLRLEYADGKAGLVGRRFARPNDYIGNPDAARILGCSEMRLLRGQWAKTIEHRARRRGGHKRHEIPVREILRLRREWAKPERKRAA